MFDSPAWVKFGYQRNLQDVASVLSRRHAEMGEPLLVGKLQC